MTPHRLELDPDIHELGEQATLPFPLVTALAWWVSAELVRRHPHRRLRIVEAHPISIYDCVTILDLASSRAESQWLVHLNLEGHITPEAMIPDGDLDRRFNWYEVLAASDRRTYVVEQLERVLGLTPPATTPPTTERSIGPRLLARFAASAALSARTWRIRAGFGFGSDWGPFREDLFEAFPMIPTDRFVDHEIPESSRFWFICDHEGQPRTAFDLENGIAWTPESREAGHHLLGMYGAHGSSLDRVLAQVAPPIE